ncbi:MAG: CopD family protein [Ilumatobacteraceae bacterium]|nr:CopD family protein [Ilumatobacteraceae bacterium]
MPRSTSRRFLLVVLAALTALATFALPAGRASAHNTLLSSDPADGSSLTAAPTQITWTFNKTVPLETMTVTLIDSSGVRSELSGSTYGAAGDTEVITPLPSLQSGPVSVRWRLVGPDGHPITGRVDFTLSIEATTTAAPPAVVASTPATTSPPTTSVDDGDGLYSTPSLVRWLLRYSSYLAIMAIVGILLTTAYVWAGAGSRPFLRRILSRSLFATAALAFAQLLVVASDVSGKPTWASLGSIDAATTTDAGMAFAIRIVLALSMWVVLFHYHHVHPEVYWTAASLAGAGLLATWAFAGHSSSMRWPVVGVATDVAHHAAAAAWIAGLAIVGWIVIPKTAPNVLVPAVRRFSRLAAVSVAVLVVTGLAQSMRLIGNPTNLFDNNHGKYLALKMAVLALMLAVANVNRRRVETRLGDAKTLGRHIGPLRQAIVTEFAIGLAIVAITAAMVVSPPATSQSGMDAPTETESPGILHSVVFMTKGLPE